MAALRGRRGNPRGDAPRATGPPPPPPPPWLLLLLLLLMAASLAGAVLGPRPAARSAAAPPAPLAALAPAPLPGAAGGAGGAELAEVADDVAGGSTAGGGPREAGRPGATAGTIREALEGVIAEPAGDASGAVGALRSGSRCRSPQVCQSVDLCATANVDFLFECGVRKVCCAPVAAAATATTRPRPQTDPAPFSQQGPQSQGRPQQPHQAQQTLQQQPQYPRPDSSQAAAAAQRPRPPQPPQPAQRPYYPPPPGQQPQDPQVQYPQPQPQRPNYPPPPSQQPQDPHAQQQRPHYPPPPTQHPQHPYSVEPAHPQRPRPLPDVLPAPGQQDNGIQGRPPASSPSPSSAPTATSPLLPEPDVCGKVLTENRITNGKIAGLGQFPWMALLGYQRRGSDRVSFFCGGTLINDRHVLTAAHCLNPANPLVIVRLGEYNLTSARDCDHQEVCADPHMDIEVESTISHPDYDFRTIKNDIALIRLARNVSEYTDYVRPICLPVGVNVTDDSKFKIAGWGKTDIRDTVGSPVLEFTEVRGVGHAECNDLQPAAVQPLDEGQLCAGGDKGKDACKGDSGGPLMVAVAMTVKPVIVSYQVGVVSYGPDSPCGTAPLPSIYTRVSTYMPWILDNLSP